MSLAPAAPHEVAIGVPLPWPSFEQDDNRPLEQGCAGVDGNLDEALAAVNAAGFEFRDMRLRIGDRIQIQLPVSVAPERFIVKVIGYVDKVALLITAPVDNGLHLPLRENDEIVARVFSSQKAFGFSSSVKRVCKTPFGYLHLSFPERIQGAAVRSSPRVRTHIIASVARSAADGGDECQAGLIADLSADGALIRARQPLAERDETILLSFRVRVHDVDAYLSVNAVVRGVFDDTGGKDAVAATFSHGVQFQDLQPSDRMILQSLIYQQMIEQPHSLT